MGFMAADFPNFLTSMAQDFLELLKSVDKIRHLFVTLWISVMKCIFARGVTTIDRSTLDIDGLVQERLTHWSYVFLALTHGYHTRSEVGGSCLVIGKYETIMSSLHSDTHYSDVMMSTMVSHITTITHDCLLNHLFRRRSKKTSKLCVTGLYMGNSPVTGEFPAQRASNEENISIWWRHHGIWTNLLEVNICCWKSSFETEIHLRVLCHNAKIIAIYMET